MGYGYHYTCNKCKHEYTVDLGVGFMFPDDYREILDDISKGVYGSELQELYNSFPYAAVNGERVAYICNGCGSWEVGIDVSLYAPNEPDRIAEQQFGKKTVAEWGYVPYVMKRDLMKEYHLVKRYYHCCDKCGKRMHKASSTELQNLSCPECGSKNHAEDFLYWD